MASPTRETARHHPHPPPVPAPDPEPRYRGRSRSVTPGEPIAHETTDVDDIRLLAEDIVALIQQAAYDDMTWAEVDAALAYAGHAIKLNWAATGSVKPAEPPTVLAAATDDPDDEDDKPRHKGRGRHADPGEADQP